MTDEVQTEAKAPRARTTGAKRPAPAGDAVKRPRAPRRNGPDLSDFKTFLAGLGTVANPTIHVNGAAFPQAVLTVDFGTPLKGTKLTMEQSNELVGRLRKATRDVLGKEANVRVSNDSHAGIWWTSVG